MKESYDAIVIGTGQAGPPLAVRLAGAGRRVAIIEHERFGGTCVNRTLNWVGRSVGEYSAVSGLTLSAQRLASAFVP